MILFLHGEDTYRSRQKLKELKEKFKKEVDPQGYNLSHLYAPDVSFGDLVNALHAAPFMAEKRMVILELLSQQKRSEEEDALFLEMIDELIATDTIVLVFEEKLTKIDLKKKLFKAISTTPYVFPFPLWTQQQVAGWVRQQLQESGIQIEPQALQFVSASVGTDLWKASSEVSKLISYAQAKQAGITYGDVKKLVHGGVQDDIFGLVDAISAKRTPEALKRLTDQLDSGSHEFAVLSMVQRQLRILQQVKDGATEGIHPFVVKKTMPQAQAFSQEKITTSFKTIKQFDEQAKRSIVEPRQGMIKSVVEICEN